MLDKKLLFLWEHKRYDLKVKVRVLSNEPALFLSNHSPGSTADILIMRINVKARKAAQKVKVEHYMADTGTWAEQCPSKWALFREKAYQGALDVVHTIPSIRRRKGNCYQLHILLSITN